MDLKRLAMVPLLSSAARMPLPGATSALAVAASSSAVMRTSRGLDSLQYPAQAAVGRVAQPARLQPRKLTSTASSGRTNTGAGSSAPGRVQRPPAATPPARRTGSRPPPAGPAAPRPAAGPPAPGRGQPGRKTAAGPAAPARAGRPAGSGPRRGRGGTRQPGTSRAVVLDLEPVPGPLAGQVKAVEPLGHHPLQPLGAG